MRCWWCGGGARWRTVNRRIRGGGSPRGWRGGPVACPARRDAGSVLTGAGGVGKSQLATAAFHRACGRGGMLVWVSASLRPTLTQRVNLAYWQGIAGTPATAVDELTRLQAGIDRVLGPEHPRALRTR